ncbi:hypothetical protein Bca52824_028079 [Brassica carinata]|uniref:Uncharacterized protein n=1 Tax=Brassica carinata TaxID=52824 RepID=A0A8X7VBT9_BRACI|nr:hypothetical protein Bca52824_028079 [Brassica carinata]
MLENNFISRTEQKKKFSLPLRGEMKGDSRDLVGEGSEMEEEHRDMKAHKAYYNMLDFVANAQQGIPKPCLCGSITKELVDESDTYDYLPGKRYFICKDYENDGLHFRQPWIMGMQQEIERLKERPSPLFKLVDSAIVILLS